MITVAFRKVEERILQPKDADILADIKDQLYEVLYRVKHQHCIIRDKHAPPIDRELDDTIVNYMERMLVYAQHSEININLENAPEIAQGSNFDELYFEGQLYRIVK